MRLFIDSDMLLDFVAERPQTREAWNKLNALELTGTAELWVGAASFERVRSALATAVADGEARSALRSTMGFLSVCSVDGGDVRFALDHGGVPYETALTEACARKIQADFINTGTGPVDISRPIRRVEPEEFFEVLEREQGIVFDLIDF